MPGAAVDRAGALLGLAFYTFDRAHRLVATQNVAAAFPTRTPRERRLIVRAAFAHFGRLLFELLKFSTLSPEQMLARVEFDGEDRVRLAYAQGKGVLFVTGTSGSGSCRRWCTRSGCRRWRSWPARSTTNC